MKNLLLNIVLIITSAVFSSHAQEISYFQKLSKFIKQQVSGSSTDKRLFERGKGYWSKPADEAKKDFFGKLTDPKSQREDWYKVSPYIAEFWCMLSNAGFIYVGLQHKSPELIFAGTASMMSHSIPKKWLLYVDKLGVAVALSKVIRNYDVIVKNPALIIPVGIAGGLNAADAYFARNKGYTVPHVIWHLSAAYIAHLFLNYIGS